MKPIRLDVYRLAGHFAGSPAICGASGSQHIAALEKEFLCDETSRILLQSATILRMLDDESEADWDERDPFYCGNLESGGAVTPLTLREACNKIIHAQKINFDEEATPGSTQTCFRPIVYLYGRQRAANWKATIMLLEYLGHAARLLVARDLQEFIEWNDKYGRT